MPLYKIIYGFKKPGLGKNNQARYKKVQKNPWKAVKIVKITPVHYKIIIKKPLKARFNNKKSPKTLIKIIYRLVWNKRKTESKFKPVSDSFLNLTKPVYIYIYIYILIENSDYP